jgi:PAS domain S-box-containing protein
MPSAARTGRDRQPRRILRRRLGFLAHAGIFELLKQSLDAHMLTTLHVPDETALSSYGRQALAGDNLFRTHFDNLPLPAYLWGRSGADFVLLAHNRAAAALHFSEVTALIGISVRDLPGTFDLLPDLELSAARGIVVKREVEFTYSSSGTQRRLVMTFVPLSPEMVAIHTDDVTERRRIERALRESEAKYRTIVDAAHEGIWAVDAAGITTYVNRHAAELLGYEPSEVVGRDMLELVATAQRDEARRSEERHCLGFEGQYELCLRHRDGSDVWVSIAGSPITAADGTVAGAIKMITDITARRQTDEALRASEARVRALLDANPDLIVRVSRDGMCLDAHCTDALLEACFPRPARELIGRNVRDVFDAGFARQHEQHCELALATGQAQRWELVRHAGGQDRYFEARFVKSGDDEVVITWRDITQRVELEREVIMSSERERTRLGHDLHDGLAQLLIGVKLLLTALKDKLAASGSQHQESAVRAADLVSLAIEQTGELAQGLSPIRKRGLLSDALRQLARQSERLLGVPCAVLVNEAPAALRESSATHLYRIAQEAITNAVKHGQAKRIEISCRRDVERAELVLTVADDGQGLCQKRGEGGGMGMHIMRYRAHSIGGELTIGPRDGGGTAVRCACPWPNAAGGGAERD